MLFSRSLKIAVLAVAAFAAGCDRQSGDTAQPQASASAAKPVSGAGGVLDRTNQGKPLPDLMLKDQAGGTLKLASLKGKPVLINLWATWCAPCIAELPTLNALANRADLNLAVVTVSQDMAQTEKVRPFLDQRGLARLPGWLDPKGDLAFHYGAQTLPATIYYDAEGKEIWRYTGERDWGSAASMALLAEGGAR